MVLRCVGWCLLLLLVIGGPENVTEGAADIVLDDLVDLLSGQSGLSDLCEGLEDIVDPGLGIGLDDDLAKSVEILGRLGWR